jgi:hypothetical protein
MVHPGPDGRGYPDMTSIQRVDQSSLWASPSFSPPLRVGRLSPHQYGRGVSRPLPGTSSLSWLPRRGAESPAVHRRAPSTVQPRRVYPQSAVVGGGHEPGAPIGAPGAILTDACQGDVPGPFAISPGAPGHAGSSN